MTNFDRSGLHTPQDNIPLEQVQAPIDEQDDIDQDAADLYNTNPDQTAYIDQSLVERTQGPTMMDVYQGDASLEIPEDDFDTLVELEMRDGETDDVMEAVEEGLTYVLPIDPPITSDPATGTGFDLGDDEEDDDDMVLRVRNALRSDSLTINLVGRLHIAVINGIAVVRGEVDDLEDTDNVVAVISEVPGIEAVRDETIVRGL